MKLIIKNTAIKALSVLGNFKRSNLLQNGVITIAIYPENNKGTKMGLAKIITKTMIIINNEI